MPPKQKYTVAPGVARVAGQRVKPGQVIELTANAARYELDQLKITPVAAPAGPAAPATPAA